MAKLNQIIAVLNGVKSKTKTAQTAIYQMVQKSALFQGVSRTYEPRDEDGYVYPAETQLVQFSAQKAVSQFVEASSELYDVALTQDSANLKAVVDLTLDGLELKSLPVTYLLFLEDHLKDVETFVVSLPVLPLDKEWQYDPNKGVYASTKRDSAKTKKITDFVVAYQATKEHPAQVKEVSKDVVEGTWSTVDLSGAIPQDVKSDILRRVGLLSQAVLKARQEANSIDAPDRKIADSLFDYIFGSMGTSTK
jgi:hypothetical protein